MNQERHSIESLAEDIIEAGDNQMAAKAGTADRDLKSMRRHRRPLILAGLAVLVVGALWAASQLPRQQEGMEPLQTAYGEAISEEGERKYTFEEMLDLPVPPSPTPPPEQVETRVQFVQVVMPVEVRQTAAHPDLPTTELLEPFLNPTPSAHDIARAVADEIQSRPPFQAIPPMPYPEL